MKLTLKSINNKLQKINPTIKISSKVYINNKVKIKCLCKKCKWSWSTNWNALQSGYGCPPCGRQKTKESQKLSISEVRKRLRKISPSLYILGSYVNNVTPLKCKCLICDTIWLVRWSDLHNGHGCPHCSKQHMGPVRLSEVEIKSRIKKRQPNVKILGKYFDTPVKCKCKKCNYIWERPTWETIQGCPKCSGKVRLTILEINEKLKKLNPDIKVTKDITPSLRKCICLRCKKIWLSNWSKLSLGVGCPNPKCRGDSKFEIEVREILSRITGLSFPKSRPSFTKGRGKVPLELDCYNKEYN